MSLLRVEALRLELGLRPLLDGVSFDVEAGEVFGLIGESGSGKSMTALALVGLAPEGARTGGRALLGGRDLLALSDRELRRVRGAEIGLVFQEPATALNPLMTIGDQVAETLLIHRRAGRAEAADRAGAALERVGLPPDRVSPGRYPHELSGGQRQRAAIAMATCLRPRLLIADEPTTALDVTTQARILDLLTRLAREDGMGLMLITHDLAVVAGLARRVAVMRWGRVVEAGPTAAALGAPRSDYAKALRAAGRLPARRRRAPPGAPLLTVRDAVRLYPGPRRGLFRGPPRRAVDGVSFTLRRGETVALVGESGSGKSTLARAVLGLEPLQAGEIRLDGEPVDGARPWPAERRRRVQAVFQDPAGSFDPRWRLERLVCEPLHLAPAAPRGAARRRAAAAALEAVGLDPEMLDRRVHALSGGQRQRLAIARALIAGPDLVVLDEAVSALDMSLRGQVLALLARLQDQRGLAYLLIAHDLALVRSVADRVLVMKDGALVEQGETEALFAAPRHAYTQALLAASPDLDAALARRATEAAATPTSRRSAPSA